MAGPLSYVLHCRTGDGKPVRITYSPFAGELVDEEGTPLFADAASLDFAPAAPVSPQRPGRKSARVATLKIQLGMRCNYACSYCNQSSAAPDATVSRTADVESFVAGLDDWLEGAPQRIEFWGGEPLLYFAKLRRLVPALRARFPDAQLGLVTNGSLLDEEILGFLERWDLRVGVSHDGPGQHLRGPDPFDDPVKAHWLRELWRRRGGARRRVSFNVVFTPANADLAATRAWLAGRVGDDDIALETEGIVSVYDDRTLAGPGRWTPRDYHRLREGIVAAFRTGDAFRFEGLREKAKDFLLSVRQRRPAAALGQKCGMDRPDQLAVDLHGKVMTCQATGAQGRHALGHVSRLQDVALTTATHWSHRECCTHCPVVQLCQGGCMFLQDAHFAQSCENEYHYNLGVLEGVLALVTGLRLERIEGDIRRPAGRRQIPIAAVAA